MPTQSAVYTKIVQSVRNTFCNRLTRHTYLSGAAFVYYGGGSCALVPYNDMKKYCCEPSEMKVVVGCYADVSHM